MELEMIQKTKYFGVEIDNSLNWKEHIKTVPAKALRAIGFLRHANTFLPLETIKTVYNKDNKEVLLSHTFGIFALSGAVLLRMSLINCKNFKTELQGF